jgi:class 3 adenylate cyclase
MLDAPETRFAVAQDGAHIAYQVVGEGPEDLVYVPNWASPVDLMWEHPLFRGFLERLSSFGRLILFDKRGSGASDNVALDALATLENWADDIGTVMDAVGSRRAAIVGAMTGVPIAALFAATHPQRTTALVLINPARTLAYGDELESQGLDEVMDDFMANWGTPRVVQVFAPSMEGDSAFATWLARFCRVGNPPAMATAVTRAQLLSDLRQVLPVIQTPTLLVQRSGNEGYLSSAHARLLADQIAGARFVEVPGVDLLPYTGDTAKMLDEIEGFLTGDRPKVATDRVLATVLFTDIVASTMRAMEIGDRKWRSLLDVHFADARNRIEHYRGRFIKTTGDGILATFDGPGRAIHCARAIQDAAQAVGLELRAGLHTGEVEVMADDIGGVAVHIAARVLGLATPTEVWVSSSIPPLVVGSGIEFVDQGEHELKGVPGTWRLFAVRS